MRTTLRAIGIASVALLLTMATPAAAERGAAGQPAPDNPPDVQKPDVRRGVAFQIGDVLAGVGTGQIKHFSPTGTLIQTLDNNTSSNEQTGMCFDSDGNLYSTNFSAASMSKFDNTGTLLQSVWASGFSARPESCVFDGTDIYSGEVDGSSLIRQFAPDGTPGATWDPAVGPRGVDWLDLAEDGCTMFYASEGSSIYRYDICTDTQLPNFADGIPGSCFALRIRPIDPNDFEVLVACLSNIHRLDSSGSVVQSYPASGFNPPASFLFAMNLDPDGTSLWTGDINTGDIYRISIGSSGNQITHFPSNPNTTMAGITVVGEITAGVPTPTPTGPPGTPTPTPTVEPVGAAPIPTVSTTGVAIFVGLLAFAAFVLLIRMRQ
jgi:hypothetical protein